MASLMAWLAEPWSGSLPFDGDALEELIGQDPTRLRVLAALHGLEDPESVFACGVIVSGGGRYGRMGRTDGSVRLKGWLAGTDGAESQALDLAIKAEWARVDAWNAEEERRWSESLAAASAEPAGGSSG